MTNNNEISRRESIVQSLEILMGDPRRIPEAESTPRGEEVLRIKNFGGVVLASLKTISVGGNPPEPLVIIQFNPGDTLKNEIFNFNPNTGAVVHSPASTEPEHVTDPLEVHRTNP